MSLSWQVPSVSENYALDQSTGLISGLCGLGVVCGGLALVAVVVVMRLGGRGLLPLLSLILNRRTAPKVTVSLPTRRRVDLRARAQSVDFDSALAAARQDDHITPPPSPTTPAQRTFTRPWVRERGRRPSNEDEIFGGMLDVDGDGEPDL